MDFLQCLEIFQKFERFVICDLESEQWFTRTFNVPSVLPERSKKALFSGKREGAIQKTWSCGSRSVHGMFR